MGTGTFPGYAFGVLGPQLVAEFSLSRFELGLLTTSFFLVGGGLSLAAGRAVDHFGGKLVMSVSFLVLGSAVLGMATSATYPVLLAMAALAGIALAAGNPTTNKLVAVNVPLGHRGLTMGAKQAGVQVGAFLTGALLAPLAVAVGWRAALGWSAVIPLLGVLAAVLIVPRDDHRRAADAGPPEAGRLPSRVRWLALYAFLMGRGVATVNAYLPLYLVERGAASPAVAGAVVALIGFTGIVSRVLWGWGSEQLRSFSQPLIVLGAGAVAATGMIGAVQFVGLWAAWLAAIVFGATAVTWNSVGMLAVLAASGPRLAGLASGVVLTGFYVGFVGSPMLFGWIVDHAGGYVLAWTLVAAMFGAATLVVVAWQRVEPMKGAVGGTG
ncbi:MFS transporter [soil metagenome]